MIAPSNEQANILFNHSQVSGKWLSVSFAIILGDVML